MGYNRRALYLRDAAKIICEKYGGVLPRDVDLLDELPGIGRATACAIVTFAYNIPVAYIETNIRRIYIHHFFSGRSEVADSEIMPIIEKTIDREYPREWYYALMDYGAYLGRQGENANVKSKYYTKQKKFTGSVREVRGGVVRELLKKSMSIDELQKIFIDERLFTVVEQLEREGFILKRGQKYCIK
jgi:A/G-specific adenine glycosylase